jgi:glycosyltransferase involved in cell wall biosynthesis
LPKPDPRGTPRVSAVIPTYNRGPLIARAIESVLGQTRPPDEIVVVDDGSADDTAERVRPYLDRIRYVRQANAGSSAARNRGVHEASHPWIAFLDSDDHWRPDHLRLMVAAIAATGGAARFYFGDTIGSQTEGGQSFWSLAGLEISGPFELAADGSDWVMRSTQPTMLQASVFRRATYIAVGGLDPAIALRHDTLLFLQLGLGGAVCAVAGAGAVMTDDDAPGARLSATHSDETPRYWRETVTLYERVLRDSSGLRASHRRDLRRRLAMAHMRLARFALADRAPAHVAGHAGRAALYSPRIATRRAATAVRPRAARTPA